MSNYAKPNIGILIATQFISVLGDSFGQRCSRVNYKHSTRHMMIGLCLISALQMFFIMGILQIALPTSISGAIYIDNIKQNCYYELDIQGKIMDCSPSNCTVIECPSQGPFSIPKSILKHPFLLTNGIMNIIYYNGEVFLYKEPLGLLFLVVSALSSTFLINPLNYIFGEPINQPIPVLIYIFGIGGCLLSVMEFSPKKEIKELKDINEEDKHPLLLNDDENKEPSILDDKTKNEKKLGVGKIIIRCFSILIPIVLLSIATALWVETTLFYNDQFRQNVFGYNSLDQTLLPFYLFPFMLFIDLVKPLKRAFYNEEDCKESLFQAVKSTWKETNLFTLFMYRFLINGRSILYFYLAIEYDLTMVYLELTLVRVVMNWFGAIILNLLLPKWIGATLEERKKAFSPLNIILKCIGSASIVASLIILNK